MPGENATEMLLRETRVMTGPVPHELGGEATEPDRYTLCGDTFLLHTGCGMRIFYRKGEGLTVERGPATTDADEQLYRHGMAYAAVAAINGLYPIHAGPRPPAG